MCVFFTAIGVALQPEKGLGPDVPGVYFIGDLSFIVKLPKGKSFLTSESSPFFTTFRGRETTCSWSIRWGQLGLWSHMTVPADYCYRKCSPMSPDLFKMSWSISTHSKGSVRHGGRSGGGWRLQIHRARHTVWHIRGFYEWTPAIYEGTPQIPTERISRQLWDIFSWQMVQVSLLSHSIFYFCLLNAFTSLRAPAEQSQGDHLLQH